MKRPAGIRKLCLMYFGSECACCKGFGSTAEGFELLRGKGVAVGSRLDFVMTIVWIDVCLGIESREICDDIGWWSLRLWMGAMGLICLKATMIA